MASGGGATTVEEAVDDGEGATGGGADATGAVAEGVGSGAPSVPLGLRCVLVEAHAARLAAASAAKIPAVSRRVITHHLLGVALVAIAIGATCEAHSRLRRRRSRVPARWGWLR